MVNGQCAPSHPLPTLKPFTGNVVCSVPFLINLSPLFPSLCSQRSALIGRRVRGTHRGGLGVGRHVQGGKERGEEKRGEEEKREEGKRKRKRDVKVYRKC